MYEYFVCMCVFVRRPTRRHQARNVCYRIQISSHTYTTTHRHTHTHTHTCMHAYNQGRRPTRRHQARNFRCRSNSKRRRSSSRHPHSVRRRKVLSLTAGPRPITACRHCSRTRIQAARLVARVYRCTDAVACLERCVHVCVCLCARVPFLISCSCM